MYTAIGISLFAIFLSYLESRNYIKYGLLLSVSILTIFVGIRYEWGTDMPFYNELYEQFVDSGLTIFDIKGLSQIRDTRSAEIGWAILNMLCKPVGFFGMIILIAIVEGVIIYDSVKRYVDKQYYWLAIYLYAMNPYLMVLGCSMIRQWLAMCIILFAIRFIISGRFWLFALLIFIAGSFHSSALLFIVLYLVRFLLRTSIGGRTFPVISVVAVIWLLVGGLISSSSIGILLGFGAFEGYDTYVMGNMSANNTLGFGGFLKIFICLFCLYQVNSLKDDRRVLCWLLVFYIVLFPLTNTVTLANRLNLYIEIFAILAIPVAMKVNPIKSWNKIIVGLLILFNYVLYKAFFYTPSFHLAYFEYHTIFEVPWQ